MRRRCPTWKRGTRRRVAAILRSCCNTSIRPSTSASAISSGRKTCARLISDWESATARECSGWPSSSTTSTAGRTTSTPTWNGRCEALGLSFAPEAERFLRGAVRVAEDHAVGGSREAVSLPGRNDENVVRGEIETLAPDIGAAPPFDHAVHRAVGAAMLAAGESRGQPLHENRQGRERILASVATGIAQLP